MSTSAIDPSLASTRPVSSSLAHAHRLHEPPLTRTSHTTSFATRLRTDDSRGAIDPSLASEDPTRPFERLPHRLQTAADNVDLHPLSRQTSLGQSSNAESQSGPPTSPGQDSITTTPARGRLPSISELIASGHESRTFGLTSTSPSSNPQLRSHPPYSHHRSTRSVGSTGHQSPLLPSSHSQTASAAQMSPSAYAAYPAYPPTSTSRSPTSAVADGPYYGAPQFYPPNTSFPQRRPSVISDGGVALPPSLNSTSSSGESGGTISSGVDDYSTTNTTPIDTVPTDDTTPRPSMMLPPPPALMIGGFRCSYEGCTAPPFQTQYLLTSHKNVHSQNRPHYCPVKNCPRAEGGKGFKRKNEMIRHGLVHSSPGYVCPFCPEREHKYPRPDNLQRHVRVHHVDKDRDDPALQEVLNQRSEGQGKTRRRRTLANSPSTI